MRFCSALSSLTHTVCLVKLNPPRQMGFLCPLPPPPLQLQTHVHANIYSKTQLGCAFLLAPPSPSLPPFPYPTRHNIRCIPCTTPPRCVCSDPYRIAPPFWGPSPPKPSRRCCLLRLPRTCFVLSIESIIQDQVAVFKRQSTRAIKNWNSHY